MFFRYALHNLPVRQIRPIFVFYKRCMCSKKSKDKLISTFQSDDKILDILNYKSINYISRYEIPISQVNALLLHREKHGLYKSLEDVLQVEGMTKNILVKFLNSLVNDKQHQKNQKIKKSIIVPKVDYISQKKISTVLGIYIGINVVTWALLENKENILEWNYENFSLISDTNSTLHLLEMASQLNNKLPKSDVYVMDEMMFDHRIAKSVRYLKPFLQKQQLKAMILAFLQNRNTDAEDKLKRNFYLTQHDKVANFYGLRVGNEVTSSAKIMNKLIYREENVNNKKDDSFGVYASENIMNIYEKQLDYVQDQMNWSLLTALTFLQLAITPNNRMKFFNKEIPPKREICAPEYLVHLYNHIL